MDRYGMPVFERAALEMVGVRRYWVGGMIFHPGKLACASPERPGGMWGHKASGRCGI